jgi:ubiquinone/menaquinone biosynthesis C-methylase UbiE
MSQQPVDTQSAYQKDGVQYLQKIIQLFGGYKKRGVEFLKIAPGLSVLDVGCGTGEDALAIAGFIGPNGNVVGVDNNETMLQAAKQCAASAPLPVTFQTADAAKLPFDDNMFDRVRADRVFQHLKNPEAALNEMIRVTKKDGWISVLDVDWATLLVDSADQSLTRKIMNYHYQHQTNGSAGIQLYGLLKRSALTDVEAYAETVCVTEWPVASMIWGLEIFARKAAADGAISNDEVLAWLKDLETRSQNGQFFSSITGFVVRGRKPFTIFPR